MGDVRRFEDLVAWQLARELTSEVYAITRQGTFSRDFGLVDQMRRAVVSVMSNIAEGFERDSIAERLHFYAIAKASCAELRSQLYVALDAGYIDQPTFDILQARADRTARVLSGLRTSTSRTRRPPTAPT
jgi:four helix bundle protein